MSLLRFVFNILLTDIMAMEEILWSQIKKKTVKQTFLKKVAPKYLKNHEFKTQIDNCWNKVQREEVLL